jgi:16S rRNA (cytosine1402-N4)-methyltransferase
MDATRHKSVLLQETIEGLNLHPGATVVDATLGGGGHSLEILKRIGPEGRLLALDVDVTALERFRKTLASLPWAEGALETGRVRLFEKNYSELESVLTDAGVEQVAAVVADLGFSSDQMDTPERGLSFLREGPLDMRLGRAQTELTAQRIVNTYTEKELARLIGRYGGERFAGRIARAIVTKRQTKPLNTTTELAEIVEWAVPQRVRFTSRIHPATKTFQALRIAVNRELEHLETFLPQAIEALEKGGRLAVIAFHSGEDRLVKRVLRENAGGCICPPEFPLCRCGREPKIKIRTSKPITSTSEEREENPRARSAKLRIAEKLH